MYEILLWAAVIGCALLFGVPALDRWLYRRRYPSLPAPPGYTVEFESPGSRAGYLYYREGGRSARFDWEVGARGHPISILLPSEEEWARTVRWPTERRDEIVDRIAREVWRQRCRHCTWTVDGRSIHFRDGKPR